jgi:hypothetical protein
MADNTVLPGAGDTIRDKDRAGIKTQIVGLDLNVAGEEVLGTGDATNGLDVDVTRVSGNVATTVADGANVTIGATADTSSANTVIGRLKKLLSVIPAALGQTTKANSLSVVLASDSDALAVSGSVTISGTAEDAAHVSGDVGLMALGVRKATPADLSGTDGDYEPFQVKSGRLWASATIDAALPAGTNNIGDIDVLTVPADPFGANADAVVAAGAAGSLSAKLRRVTQGLEDLKTTIVLAAGSAAIGKLAANAGVNIGTVDIATTPKSGTATLSNVASSATNVTLLASNAARLGATIYNDSTQVLYVKFGTTASATSYVVQIAANGYYEVPGPAVYTGRIDGIWASANGNARVTELT